FDQTLLFNFLGLTPRLSPTNKGRKFITFEEKGFAAMEDEGESGHRGQQASCGQGEDKGEGTSAKTDKRVKVD
ncbi:hypothetical protein PGT21_010083, partial [Puccinia graminis f. sp. tritici]